MRANRSHSLTEENDNADGSHVTVALALTTVNQMTQRKALNFSKPQLLTYKTRTVVFPAYRASVRVKWHWKDKALSKEHGVS